MDKLPTLSARSRAHLRAYLPATLTATAGAALVLVDLSAAVGWTLIVFGAGLVGVGTASSSSSPAASGSNQAPSGRARASHAIPAEAGSGDHPSAGAGVSTSTPEARGSQEGENEPHKSIVALVSDDSVDAGAAAQVAGRLARALELRLLIAHMAEDAPTLPQREGRRREARRRALRRGRELLEPLAGAIPDIDAEIEVVLASRADGLEGLLRRQLPQLLVMDSGFDFQEMSRAATCPLVAVPPGAARRFFARDLLESTSIVCGLDGSEPSGRALRVARGLATRLGDELILGFVDPSGPWPEAPEEVQVETGDPVDGLSELASREGARLVVVGSRGHGRLASALLGSVARDLAASAPVPVLVVPPRAAIPDFGLVGSRRRIACAA